VTEVLGVGDDHRVDGIDLEGLAEIGLRAQNRDSQVVGVEPLVRRCDAVGHPDADDAEPGQRVVRESQRHGLGAADATDDEHLGQEVATETPAEHPPAPGPTLDEEQRGSHRE
jgi:hypothetical protein